MAGPWESMLLHQNGPEAVQAIVEELCGGGDYECGDLEPGQLGRAHILKRLLYQWDKLVETETVGDGLLALMTLISNELFFYSGHLKEPWCGAAYKLGELLAKLSVGVDQSYMESVPWGSGFGKAYLMASQYEREEDRTTPLTIGEFYFCLAACIREWETALTRFKSKIDPPGYDKKPANLRWILDKVKDFLAMWGWWHGCARGPDVPFDLSDTPPDDWEPGFSY